MTKKRLLLVLCVALLGTGCGSETNSPALEEGPPDTSDADTAPVMADVLGIRLGMAPHEVVAAVKSRNPSLGNIGDVVYHSLLADTGRFMGAATRDTEGAFALKYIAQRSNRAHRLDVSFFQPPAKNVVGKIQRKLQYNIYDESQRISLDVYRTALVEKYGEPTIDALPGYANVLQYRWLWPADGTNCSPNKWVDARRGLPAGTDTCATTLIVNISATDSIVQTAEFILGNPLDVINAREDYLELIIQKSEEYAEEQRQQATEKPAS